VPVPISAPPVVANAPESTTTRPVERSPKSREWTPHFWIGCNFFAWVRLLSRNGFAVHWSLWYVAAVASVLSVVHTALKFVQLTLYGREIAKSPIRHAPVFIIGHWRTGTTFLHELLIRDSRHAFPTTFECLSPNHFLLTGSWLPRFLRWMLPRRRPMDNLPAGWDRPQEDEFALCLLGLPSPYGRIAFPNRPASDDGALDLQGLSPRERRRWAATFLQFIREVTLAHGGRRLILKSPPHTCRIPTLLELFPDARFIHLVRDPYVVYPSTLNLWRTLYRKQGLQRPTFDGLDEYVLQTFVQLYDRLEEGKKALAPDRFVEMKYEDLIRDPLGQLDAIYRRLDLGDFAAARPHVAMYLATMRDYETNRYQLAPGEKAAITERWGHVIRRYGYALQS
jgi:hypothetical protein